MSLSSISSRVKFICMMAGEKRHYFTSCKTSRIGTFDEVLLDVSTFQNKNAKQTLEPAQYGLEGTFNCVFKCDDLLCIYYVYATGLRSAPTSSRRGVVFFVWIWVYKNLISYSCLLPLNTPWPSSVKFLFSLLKRAHHCRPHVFKSQSL